MSRQSFRDRSVAKQSPSVFNQLPRPRLQRLFGRRSALFTGVKRDRLLERRRNMTTETGVQRKLILAGGIIELWTPHALRLQETKITKMFQRDAVFSKTFESPKSPAGIGVYAGGRVQHHQEKD